MGDSSNGKIAVSKSAHPSSSLGSPARVLPVLDLSRDRQGKASSLDSPRVLLGYSVTAAPITLTDLVQVQILIPLPTNGDYSVKVQHHTL